MMPEHALAPRTSHHPDVDHTAGMSEDPFASPALPSPTLPRPCAASPREQQRFTPSPAAAASREASTRYERSHQKSSSLSHKPTSVSSAGESTLITPMSSMDLEKARYDHEQERQRELQNESKRPSRESKRDSRRSRQTRDPEKAMYSGHSSPNRNGHHNTNLTYDEEDEDELDEGRRMQENKAMKILFFMAGPCVVLSAVNTVWAFIALIITALTQPIRLCARRPSFGQQLAGLLGPTLNLQLRCIYTPLPPHANEDGSYHSVMLFVVHILSPFLAMATMFASWVLAVYWLCSGVVGDPAGQDKRDDGKETVLGLRNWWERWLMKGMKEE